MLVLASKSPRRKQLLLLGGWAFIQFSPQVDESVRPGEHPVRYVRRLAESKAREVVSMAGAPLPPEALILGADTAVVEMITEGTAETVRFSDQGSGGDLRFAILGKPGDASDAESMLRRLRGRIHQVYTAIAVLRVGDSFLRSGVIVTDVPMRFYSDDEMSAYIASGDPLDKAGAYAIQHTGFKPVENFRGCYANVMGLPLCHLQRLLAAFDLQPGKNIPEECQKTLDYLCPLFQQVLESEQPFAKV